MKTSLVVEEILLAVGSVALIAAGVSGFWWVPGVARSVDGWLGFLISLFAVLIVLVGAGGLWVAYGVGKVAGEWRAELEGKK
jgi:hypothetical protein